MSNLDEKDMTTAGTDAANIKNTDTVTTASSSEAVTWQLNALTEALGDLSLTVSDSLSVGRGSDNDVVLGSKQVSRNHALLSVLNGKLYLKDLNSSNGTFINEERIEGNKSEHLKADDTVGFASFTFQVATPIEADTDAAIHATEAPVKDSVKNSVTDTAGDVEQPVKADEPVADLEAATIDVLPTAVVDAEVIDSDVIDAEVVDAEIVEPAIDAPVEPVVVEATVLENNIPENMVDEPISETVVSDTKVEDPVQKETMISEVLSSTAGSSDVSDTLSPDKSTPDTLEPSVVAPTVAAIPKPSTAAEQDTVMSNDTSNHTSEESLNKKMLNTESLYKETGNEEPLATKPTAQQEPTVSPEQDKTTKTALQEEADPDVLRAKQAATAQFSGTANLGQPRDLGTEGNNAMDQALNNKANAGHVEKKPSGGWFVWVFIAIIIVGLALWLFNMGGA
ncbi:FHA domain-containing protein [Psychrobacter frigidicola]|uniref:FHA domain-containing protein n=1 Tax=Psychrobacter frigidicola TaxID=45611 RepID=UPI001D10FF6B|nr:FHA domain-containing protein [Psychrobacter frigidicola]